MTGRRARAHTRRRRDRIVSSVLVVSTILGLLVAASLPLYVFPATDDPERVDVVYVIGPATQSRRELALDLILERGLSDTLLVSVPASGQRSAREWSVCTTETVRFEVHCVHSEPFTTEGEAASLERLAEERGWESAAVITFTPHVSRTRFIMEGCFSGELSVIADRTPIPLTEWVYQYAYQSGAFVKALVSPGC